MRCAFANTPSVAALSPDSKMLLMLSGHSSQTGGAPGRVASAVAVTEGRGS